MKIDFKKTDWSLDEVFEFYQSSPLGRILLQNKRNLPYQLTFLPYPDEIEQKLYDSSHSHPIGSSFSFHSEKEAVITYSKNWEFGVALCLICHELYHALDENLQRKFLDQNTKIQSEIMAYHQQKKIIQELCEKNLDFKNYLKESQFQKSIMDGDLAADLIHQRYKNV